MEKKAGQSTGRKCFKTAFVLLVLVFYHFLLTLYLFLAKQIRKSMIFPGG